MSLISNINRYIGITISKKNLKTKLEESLQKVQMPTLNDITTEQHLQNRQKSTNCQNKEEQFTTKYETEHSEARMKVNSQKNCARFIMKLIPA